MFHSKKIWGSCRTLGVERALERKKRSVDSAKRKNKSCSWPAPGSSPPPQKNLFHKHEESLPRAAWLTMWDQKPSAVPQTSPLLPSPFRPSQKLIEAIHDQVTTPACQTQAEKRREAWLFQKPGRGFGTHPLRFLFPLIYDVYLGMST